MRMRPLSVYVQNVLKVCFGCTGSNTLLQSILTVFTLCCGCWSVDLPRWLALSGGTELALPSGLRGDHGGRQPPAPPTASWGAPGACGQAAEGTDPLQPGSLCQTGPGRGPLRNKAAGGPWALRVPLCEAQCGLGEWEMRQALEPGGPQPVTARAHTLPASPRGRRRTSLMSWYCPSRA